MHTGYFETLKIPPQVIVAKTLLQILVRKIAICSIRKATKLIIISHMRILQSEVLLSFIKT